MLDFKNIYPMDAVYDTPEDTPEDVSPVCILALAAYTTPLSPSPVKYFVAMSSGLRQQALRAGPVLALCAVTSARFLPCCCVSGSQVLNSGGPGR